MNQSAFEPNTCNWRQARENACDQDTIGYGILMVEKMMQTFPTNHRAQRSKTNANANLLSTLHLKPL